MPPTDALREQWRATSLQTVWLHEDDWYHPAVDAIVEALADGTTSLPACERLGLARAHNGCSIGETIDDLMCLLGPRGGTDVSAALRALCSGWAEGQNAPLGAQGCTDPETGLHTVGHLAARLAEVYGSARLRGTAASESHALVVVDVGLDQVAPWQRIARSASMGRTLIDTFGPSHPMASLGGGTFAVLVERDDELLATLDDLRILIKQDAGDLGVSTILRRPPRIWIETLPATATEGTTLLGRLGR
ncbi:hypothetical protein [Sanguibacter sp. 25GB23B1]|uniref:hypothetical protein n=1 Tax=unclassified Sanguibacter TaxID=2645534 RepID=UPI0032AF6059